MQVKMENINIQALADLLSPEQDSDSEDEQPVRPMARMGPGDVGVGKTTETRNKEKPQTNTKDIWSTDEVASGAEYEDLHDPRPEPEYDIIYKQAVTSEDMFLGMGNKTNATASCEEMVVKVTLPDCTMADVKLDVKDTFLDCRTPKYKLGLHLPHPCDSNNSRAHWDGDKHLLSVTLKLTREYDFLNF